MIIIGLTLTKSQFHASDLIDDFINEKPWLEGGKQILRIGGPAGTGKTTLMKYFMDRHDMNANNTLVMAYTGNAVNVLHRKGIPARTFHASIMKSEEVDKLDEYGNTISYGGIPYRETRFVPLEYLPENIKYLITDESSMTPKTIEDMMIRYGRPIIQLGDYCQLPPVADEQTFCEENIDYSLEDIMRQNLDSNIIKLATMIRRGERIDTSLFANGIYFIKTKHNMDKNIFKFSNILRYSSMILTCTNKQRNEITDSYRKILLNTDNKYPIKGEKLVCRRNNWNYKIGIGDESYSLTNGTIGYVLNEIPRSNIDNRTKTYFINFRPTYIENDYFDNMICDTEFLTGKFGDKLISKYNPGNKMEFAHAITTHISQGNQGRSVCYFDKWLGDAEYMRKMRYTAVTRAEENLFFFMQN